MMIAEITDIELLQVELLLTWGEARDERSRRFSTVKAVLKRRGP